MQLDVHEYIIMLGLSLISLIQLVCYLCICIDYEQHMMRPRGKNDLLREGKIEEIPLLQVQDRTAYFDNTK